MHGRSEMREIDLAKGPLVEAHVHLKASAFNAVGGEVLWVREHVLLQTLDRGHRKAREKVHVFAVRFLRSSPARMPQVVDRRREKNVPPDGAELATLRLAHSALELWVPAGSPCDGHGKRGGSILDANTSRPVGHFERRNAETFDPGNIPRLGPIESADERRSRHLRDLLFERHLGEQLFDALF